MRLGFNSSEQIGWKNSGKYAIRFCLLSGTLISQDVFDFPVIRQLYCNVGLADTLTQVVSTSTIEWRDEDSSGAVAAGWSKDDDSKMVAARSPAIPLSQWGPISESSWGNKLQVSDVFHTIIL